MDLLGTHPHGNRVHDVFECKTTWLAEKDTLHSSFRGHAFRNSSAVEHTTPIIIVLVTHHLPHPEKSWNNVDLWSPIHL